MTAIAHMLIAIAAGTAALIASAAVSAWWRSDDDLPNTGPLLTALVTCALTFLMLGGQ